MATETREQLLEAAQSVISKHGVARATTRAIAEAAGVAEGSIYRYFHDKNELIRECLIRQAPEFVELVRSLPERAGKGNVRATLTEVARESLSFYRLAVPMAAGAISDEESLLAHRAYFHSHDVGPHKTFVQLARYVEAEQRLGRLAAGPKPEAAARLLLGACLAEVFVATMLGLEQTDETDERFAREVVRALWEGVGPDRAR